MRPEKAKNIVEKAIMFYLRNNNDPAKLYQKDTLKAVQKLDKVLRKEFIRSECEYDERDPKSLNDYSEVQYELSYISDRLMAPHRINFLLCGINERLF